MPTPKSTITIEIWRSEVQRSTQPPSYQSLSPTLTSTPTPTSPPISPPQPLFWKKFLRPSVSQPFQNPNPNLRSGGYQNPDASKIAKAMNRLSQKLKPNHKPRSNGEGEQGEKTQMYNLPPTRPNVSGSHDHGQKEGNDEGDGSMEIRSADLGSKDEDYVLRERRERLERAAGLLNGDAGVGKRSREERRQEENIGEMRRDER